MNVRALRRILAHYPDETDIQLTCWEEGIRPHGPEYVIESIQLVAADPDYVTITIVTKGNGPHVG